MCSSTETSFLDFPLVHNSTTSWRASAKPLSVWITQSHYPPSRMSIFQTLCLSPSLHVFGVPISLCALTFLSVAHHKISLPGMSVVEFYHRLLLIIDRRGRIQFSCLSEIKGLHSTELGFNCCARLHKVYNWFFLFPLPGPCQAVV